jgi:putative FmdB family regulatory protein
MPTYEFRCPNGHEFEKLYRTISGAEAQAACPTCGQLAERIMSPTGFAFKGSGFYLTDYGKNAHREKGTAAKPTTEAGGSEGGTKQDVKGEGTKSTSSESTVAPAAASPATDSKPAAPKKSTGE